MLGRTVKESRFSGSIWLLTLAFNQNLHIFSSNAPKVLSTQLGRRMFSESHSFLFSMEDQGSVVSSGFSYQDCVVR